MLDDGILQTAFAQPNRVAFLRDALADLDSSLAKRGARLVLRSGDVVTETVRTAIEVQAEAIFMSHDVSGYAQARRQQLVRACGEHRVALRLFPGVTIAEAGDVTTSSGTHFSVFTPFYRAWRQVPRRPLEQSPRRLVLPANVRLGRLPALENLVGGTVSPELPAGGETEGRKRQTAWLRSGLGRYHQRHDDLAADATSRLSPSLHFGCLARGPMSSGAPGCLLYN